MKHHRGDRLVYFDARATVYVTDEPDTRPVIEQDGYTYIHPVPEQAVPLTPGNIDAFIHEWERAIKVSPEIATDTVPRGGDRLSELRRLRAAIHVDG